MLNSKTLTSWEHHDQNDTIQDVIVFYRDYKCEELNCEWSKATVNSSGSGLFVLCNNKLKEGRALLFYSGIYLGQWDMS